MEAEVLAIPEELRALRQWVCWRKVQRGDKTTKVPCTPSGKPASTTDPATWAKFQNCLSSVGKYQIAGVGFVFSDADPFCGIDLDKCLDDAAALHPWAREIVEAMDSYTEYSPSGRGLHIICRCRVGGGRRKDHVELYDVGRYFTFTGKVYSGHETINDPQEEVMKLWRRLGDGENTRQYDQYVVNPQASPPAELFSALLTNDKKFKLTWEHRRPDLKDQSLSCYDMALAALTARAGWTDEHIVALLASHRREWGGIEKIERGDYVGRTLATARAGISEGLDEKDLAEDAALSQAMQEGTSEVMTELSTILNIPVERFVRRGLEPSRIYAISAGREFYWLEQGDLLSIAKAKRAWFSQTQAIIKTMKGPSWERVAKRIVDLADYEAVDGLGRMEEIMELVADYLSVFKPIADADKRAGAVATQWPIFYDDGVAFSFSRFAGWLLSQPFASKMTRSDLRLRLLEAGYQNKRIDVSGSRPRGYLVGPLSTAVIEKESCDQSL